ncbi:MAG: ribosome recycling factor [Actinomycetia bacterium]|nr:ribosome recycling factor [Actinomycetes bacterium]
MSEELLDLIFDDTRERMTKAIEHTRSEFSTVRTGRASPVLVERLPVEAYGVDVQMREVASFSVPEARQLLISAHDPATVPAIERAIQNSDLGVNPSSDGRTIRLSFPPLTEERRREFVKLVRSMAEDGRISLRNSRREARKDLDAAEKDGDISSDDHARAEKELDKLTQEHEAGIDAALADKEQELLEV